MALSNSSSTHSEVRVLLVKWAAQYIASSTSCNALSPKRRQSDGLSKHDPVPLPSQPDIGIWRLILRLDESSANRDQFGGLPSICPANIFHIIGKSKFVEFAQPILSRYRNGRGRFVVFELLDHERCSNSRGSSGTREG